MKPKGSSPNVSEARQASLLELATDSVWDGIVAIDEQSVILFANPAMTRMFGYSSSELCGKPLTLLMPESLRDAHRASLGRYVATGQRHLSWKGVELPGLHKSGRQIPLEVSFGEIVKDGRHLFVGVLRDVTDRLRAKEALRVSEERYRSLAAASSQMVWTTTANGEVVEDSPSWRAYTGQSWEEFRGPGWMEALHPGDRSRVMEAWRQALDDSRLCDVECRLSRRDGKYGDFRVRRVPILEEDGAVREWVGMCTDIAESKQARNALEASEKRYRELVSQAPIGIYRSTREGRFDSVNLALVRLLGYETPEDVLALDIRRDIFFDDADRERVIAENERLGGIVALEVRLKRKDGSPVWVLLDSRAVRGDGNRIEGFEGFVHDISEGKRVEEALRASEQRIRALMEGARDALVVSTTDGIVLEINRAAEALFGWPRAEVVGRHFLRTLAPEERVLVRERFEGDVVRGGAQGQESVVLRADGKRIPIEVSVSRVEIGGEELMFAIIRDFSERKRAEEERARLAAIVEFSNDAITSETLDGVITSWNAGAEKLYGHTAAEAVGQPEGLCVPEDRSGESAAILEKIRGGEVLDRFETLRVRKDGTRIDVSLKVSPVRDASGAVIGASSIARDITERLRADKSLRESEQRYRSLFDSMLHGFAHCEMVFEDGEPRDFVYLDVNATFEKVTGLTSVVGKRVTQLIPGIRESNPEAFEVYGRVARTGVPEKFELFLDALGIWLSVSAYSPQKGQFVALFDDITERKRAEEALQKLQRAVEQAENVVFMTDAEGTITYVNPAFERVYGYSKEDVLGKTPRILKGGRHDRAYYQRFWGRLLAGESVREEFVNRRRNGELVTVEGSISPVLDVRKKRIGFIAVQHDVTERKRSEEALRNSEQRFSLAFHASPIPTIISEIETGRFLDVNQQFLRVLGYSSEEVIGKTSLELGIWADRGDRDRVQARVRKEGAIRDRLVRIRTRSGEIRDVVGSAVSIDLSGVKCALWTFLDITERRQVERRMQERTTFLNALVEHSPLGILVLDPDHRVQIANPAFVSLFGYSPEDLQGHNPDDLIALGDEALRAEAAGFTRDSLTGHPVHAVSARRRKDGALVEVEIYGVPLLENGRLIGVYAIYQDLSERRRLEQQLIQAQKMEAVGQLAGGVAHDFNNLLTAILGYSDLVAAKLDPGSLEFEELDEVRKAGERAASLTRQLLAFSRQQVLERKVLDVNDLIADVEKMLRRLIGEDVDLTTVLDPALRRVFADAGQLEQVIMNLAVNARDAMPRGGKLTIETANVELDESYARLHVTVRPGSYVMIAASDTGIGMNGETRAHIFEPFFTTKGLGKGTGLGLATVYGIVKQSGGYIWVYSEVGKGTTFKIYLPLVEEGAEEEPVPAAEPAALHGSETVLLVEDEQSVRTLSRSILENYGYTVLEAASGNEGLEVARRYARPIDLVLTDVVMPEMGGPDLASRLEALRPGVRVLYMSGYTDDAVFRHGLLEKGRVFLQKPFTPGTLARKVREALGE